MFLYLISPFLVIHTLATTLTTKADSNAIKKSDKISGKKKLAVISDINLPLIKKYKDKVDCTVNDYCVSLLSVSLHEYL